MCVRCTFEDKWPSCSVSRRLSCSVGPKRESTCHRAQTCSCGRQLLMPALQACCLRRAFVLRVHVTHGEELVCARPGHRVHESAKWHDCDRAALLWHAFIAKNAPMLWYAASKRGHQVWECPGNSSSEEKTSLAPGTQLVPRRLVRGDAGGDVELGQSARSIKTFSSAAATKSELGRNGQEMGPWCDVDQTRHAKLPQEYCQDVRCAWSQAQNPTTRPAGPAAVMSMSKHCLAEPTRAID